MSSELQAFLIKNSIKILQLIDLKNINAEWNFFINRMLIFPLPHPNNNKYVYAL
jgi:hypothetical protein